MNKYKTPQPLLNYHKRYRVGELREGSKTVIFPNEACTRAGTDQIDTFQFIVLGIPEHFCVIRVLTSTGLVGYIPVWQGGLCHRG